MAETTSKPSKVGNNYYKTTVTTNADRSLSSTTFRTDSKGNNPVSVQTTSVDKNGKATQTFGTGATAAEKKGFADPKSPEGQALSQQVESAKPYGNSPTAEQKAQLGKAGGGSGNAATNPTAENPSTTGTGATSEALNKEFKAGDKEGTRTKYEDLVYPLDLAASHQDIVKFSILKYVPSLSEAGQQKGGVSTSGRIITLEDGKPIVKGSERLGTITLPIPSGISDGNSARWQDQELGQVMEAAAAAAKSLFEGGPDAAAATATEQIQDKTGGGDLPTAVSSFLLDTATGTPVQARTYGVANNNNLEVLFSGPGLRSFSFTFMFYPREPDEAIRVRKIIRAFKQSMSVKRSANSLLLKAPHTFAISYLTPGDNGQMKIHPYLNKFKECALTNCNVEYTPDGTYMTYGGAEKSMTSYRMTLSFAELEPIFDDEYGDDGDASVGY